MLKARNVTEDNRDEHGAHKIACRVLHKTRVTANLWISLASQKGSILSYEGSAEKPTHQTFQCIWFLLGKYFMVLWGQKQRQMFR